MSDLPQRLAGIATTNIVELRAGTEKGDPRGLPENSNVAGLACTVTAAAPDLIHHHDQAARPSSSPDPPGTPAKPL